MLTLTDEGLLAVGIPCVSMSNKVQNVLLNL